MPTNHELVDALIDHEDVDVDALRRVLDEPEARDYLLDAHLLRRAMQAERAEGATESHDAVAPASPPQTGSRRFVLAAAMAAGLVCAFAAGRITVGGGAAPIQTVSTIEADASDSTSFPAPAATRVIQVEFRATGGN